MPLTEAPSNVWTFLSILATGLVSAIGYFLSNRSQKKSAKDAASMDSATELIEEWKSVADDAKARAARAEKKADQALNAVQSIGEMWGDWYMDLTNDWELHRKKPNPPPPPRAHYREGHRS